MKEEREKGCMTGRVGGRDGRKGRVVEKETKKHMEREEGGIQRRQGMWKLKQTKGRWMEEEMDVLEGRMK